ncbi:MAG: HD domain-containing protein [Oscillospiraceae bacterium]|nr:HD domain-containing protein [Oscillospiraceae bacterium]
MENQDRGLFLHDVLCFAAEAHQGQLRKGSDTPYIAHPFEAAMILDKAGCGTEVVAAALLHDTLEDTAVTAEELEQRFGPEILALVQWESEDKSLSWEARKQHTIDDLADAPFEVLLVACADKVSNLRSMKRDHDRIGEQLWQRFRRGREQQAWYYGELVRVLAPLADYEMYSELKKLYRAVFAAEQADD